MQKRLRNKIYITEFFAFTLHVSIKWWEPLTASKFIHVIILRFLPRNWAILKFIHKLISRVWHRKKKKYFNEQKCYCIIVLKTPQIMRHTYGNDSMNCPYGNEDNRRQWWKKLMLINCQGHNHEFIYFLTKLSSCAQADDVGIYQNSHSAIIRAHAHMQSAILIGCTCRWKCVQNSKRVRM